MNLNGKATTQLGSPTIKPMVIGAMWMEEAKIQIMYSTGEIKVLEIPSILWNDLGEYYNQMDGLGIDKGTADTILAFQKLFEQESNQYAEASDKFSGQLDQIVTTKKVEPESLSPLSIVGWSIAALLFLILLAGVR